MNKNSGNVNYYLLGAIWKDERDEKDQTKRFIQEGIWENGYNDRFVEIVNKVNQGDRVAIKSSFATKKGESILRIKATGTVNKNLLDGKTLKILWDENFTPFDLKGLGKYRKTIHEVSDKNIDAIFKTNSMDFYVYLEKFLSQANTPQLTTTGYPSDYQELKIKVSFGQGNPARIPWIAFLENKHCPKRNLPCVPLL